MLYTDCLACDLLWSAAFFFGAYLLRLYIRGGQFTENVSANGLICVVTGANSGAGKALCEELNKRGARVYMICRDVKRAQMAKGELIEKGCNGSRLIIKYADLSSFQSIRAMAKQLCEEEATIDVLVNNAGLLALPSYEKTEDGFEKTWQSNYLGHFLLTELLIPNIKESENGRIVNVSSLVHAYADTVDFETVNDPKQYGKMMSYNRSKLANVLHARKLSLLFKEGGVSIKVNSCHPGTINSNILSSSGFLSLKTFFAPIFWFFFKTEMDGAQTSLHLALSQRLVGNGLYYSDCKVCPMSEKAIDDKLCDQLYKESLEAVKLKDNSL